MLNPIWLLRTSYSYLKQFRNFLKKIFPGRVKEELALLKNISLKHIKLPKNPFKTHLFFGELKHLKTTFTFGKK